MGLAVEVGTAVLATQQAIMIALSRFGFSFILPSSEAILEASAQRHNEN